MLQNQKIILISRPEISGKPTSENFKFVDETIDPNTLEDGKIIIQILYISIDPTYKLWCTMDGYMPASPLNEPMRTLNFGKVIYSKNENFKEGDWICGGFSAQKYIITDGDPQVKYKVPDELIQKVNGPQNFIPVLGITGFPTVYSGFEITAGDMEKEGKTLVVSAAAGNVGQLAVQLGKLYYKMKVVGIAGSDEKCSYLTETLGCDFSINYKTENIGEALDRTCPEGIDLYYDNVGGEITDQIFLRINKFARVIFCGHISTYVSEPYKYNNYQMILLRSARIQGFIVGDKPELIPESFKIGAQLVSEGKLKFETCEIIGLENFVPAMDLLWSGQNKGKVYLSI